MAVLNEVEKHHREHDHKGDQEYRPKHRMGQPALKQRPEPDHGGQP
jgi:hypothetical protein